MGRTGRSLDAAAGLDVDDDGDAAHVFADDERRSRLREALCRQTRIAGDATARSEPGAAPLATGFPAGPGRWP
jgi:hypothetical protein